MPAGRPRQFDVDAALDRALEVFQRRGYEGASLAELTRAMGVNRPSLYAAFGDKEELFRRALDRYMGRFAERTAGALELPTAREVAQAWLAGAVEMACGSHGPRGCLAVQGALVCGEAAEPVKRELAACRKAGEDALRERFERAVAEGDLPAYCDAAALAKYVATVLQGLAVQAAGGASRDDLKRVAAIAMQAWPR